MKLSARLFIAVAITLYSSYAPQSAYAQGVMLRSVGAVNASVGGTATAMPLDAIGALYWNPASISALPQNEMSFGLELVQAESRVKSSVNHPQLGTISGSNKGEAGVVPVPSMGLVWSKSRQSPYTFGLGMGAVGGAASLYPHTPLFDPSGALNPNANPVLMDHGRSATVIVLQVTPTAAVQVTERLSVGVAPIVDLASLNVNPMSLGRPTDQPLMTYGTRYVWGGGFQVGTLYDFKNHFKAGFMFKSPIWAEKLYFSGTYYEAVLDDAGNPTGTYRPRASSSNFQLNLPMTLSLGFSYDGFRDTIIGLDVRYLDYSNAAGLNQGISGGVVEGLDWESVYSISIGMERKINDKLKGRLGYSWNENPIPGRSAALCVSAPMIMQHVFACGASYELAKNLEVSAAYVHAFKVSHAGELPGIPGSSVSNTIYANSLFANITKKW